MTVRIRRLEVVVLGERVLFGELSHSVKVDESTWLICAPAAPAAAPTTLASAALLTAAAAEGLPAARATPYVCFRAHSLLLSVALDGGGRELRMRSRCSERRPSRIAVFASSIQATASLR